MIEAHSDYKPVALDTRAGSIGWHGNALLVKKGVEVLEHHLFHLPSLEPRGAVLAEVRVNGTTMRVVGMHLDLSGLWRRRQAQAILAHLAERDARAADGADGRPQRMEQRRAAACATSASHHAVRALRPQLPRPAADRPARPDHGLAGPRDRRQRRPCQRDRAPRFGSSAGLGGGPARRRGSAGAALVLRALHSAGGWAARLRSSIVSQSRKGRR